MNRILRTATASLCLVLLLGTGVPAEAQTVHTLTIREGQVTINDRLVPAAELPPSLDVTGLDVSYTFIGEAQPVEIMLDGTLFVLEEGRLREAGNRRDAPGGIRIYLRDQVGDVSVLTGYRGLLDQAAPSASLARQQAQALQASKAELEKLSSEVDAQPANRALEEARQQVEKAAAAVETLPRLEVQNYYSDVFRADAELYGMLAREWQMERDALALAQAIRRLPEGPERQQRIVELRSRLNEIFDLKQQNRRLEIQQLEQQLGALNKRMQRREDWRDDIIEQRLNVLIGNSPPEHR